VTSTKHRAVVTHVVSVEVVRPSKTLKTLEGAALILESLRDVEKWKDVPISATPQVRQILSRIETNTLLIRKQIMGSNR
jgi:hypothetical protein